MAASTIVRDTWTNDTGSAAVPVGDGTLLNNNALQNNVYGRLDAMFAGAGAYATFTLGGKLAVEGFGSHTFSAGGAGGNTLTVGNTTAGTGNYARLILTNDVDTLGRLTAYSSTFTTSGSASANATVLHSQGRLNLNAGPLVSANVIGLYTGDVERARIDAGVFYINDTTNAKMTTGLTVNQGAATDEAIAVKQSSSAHGITDFAETDTLLVLKQFSGGAAIHGYGTTNQALTLFGNVNTEITTKSTSGFGAVNIAGSTKSGTGLAAMGANANILSVWSGGFVRFILDADGDSHQDVGTAWTNFDDYEDHELLSAFSAGVSRKGDPLKRAFASLLKKHKATLEQNGIVTFNKDGHHFVNWSRLNMLKVGAIRQNAMRIAALEQRMKALEV